MGHGTNILSSAPYDGFVIAHSRFNAGCEVNIAINDIIVIAQYVEQKARSAVITPFRKGDKIQIGKEYDSDLCRIAFYEHRNYTNR